MKKYLSLIGITALILIIGWLGYQALFAYLAEHTYYFGMLASAQNRWIFLSAIICSLIPLGYCFISSKTSIKNLLITFLVGAGIFGLVQSNIKGDPVGLGHVITIFNTILLVGLGIYLILGFSALGSWIERKRIKFSQFRRQEIFLTFGIGFCSFVVVVQILLGIGLLYGIVSWILFLGLGFMIWYERKQLSKWGEIFGDILDNYKRGVLSGENLGKKIWFLFILLPIIFSLAYLYMGIQNAFVPYSTAWDANHEYMYIPKILAENNGIYWGSTEANNMPGFWQQFLTFVFSLTRCSNGWFGLSSDNIAVSMNNISATFVLIFGIAIIFQIFGLINNRNNENKEENTELKKGKNAIMEELSNGHGITIGWYFLLLWLTGGMGAFLVIVDNKIDLGIMSLSLLALLSGFIFIQSRKNTHDKKEILKYLIVTGLFFGFATIGKITAFVDLALFGLLLIGLRFSSLTALGLGIMIMGLVRKFNIWTSSVMLTDENATWLIIIGGIITVIGLIIHLLKNSNREKFGKNLRDLIILGICFLIPLLFLKLPRTIISQIKTNSFSFGDSLKSAFLSMNYDKDYGKLLAQNIEDDNFEITDNVADFDIIDSLEVQDSINSSILNSRDDKTFSQCLSAGDIYSEEELNEGLQELNGGGGGEDLGRYIGYGWKEFSKTSLFSVDENTANQKWFKLFKSLWPKSNECDGVTEAENVICEKNLTFGLMKILRPTSENCYGLNHDAKILCTNANAIDSFRIDDLRGIYENGIDNKEGEAGQLLKAAIDAYDEAKSEGKLGFGTSNTTIFHDEIVNLRQYYQSHSISSTENSINIPYRYLVPLNISFNWSLQNLSSYYTDIGFFWIIVYILLIIALLYAIIKKDKVLTSFALTTLIGWGIWRIIGSSILWYGTALISWTMVTIAIFWDRILQKNEKESPKFVTWVLIILVGIFFGIQILFNFLRIASQGSTSVFVRYKGNVGIVQQIDSNLQPVNQKKYGYGWKDVFDLQFSHYNSIITALADRKDEDGVLMAGTYIQYFLGNHWFIRGDGMLLDFRKKTSDGDLCKTYRRLKNDHTHYIIIDPNIGSVTMGEGNETLFYRFFGKIVNNELELDGGIITLVRLSQAGYLKLISTNNIGAKYAFTLDDDVIRTYFGENLTDEELILTRGKMAVLQYFNDANSIFSSVAGIFLSRIINDTQGGIEDLADIYGLEIDSKKVSDVAHAYINGQINDEFAKDLSQNERAILINYLNLYLGYKQSGENGISSMIQDLLINSVTSGSQVIALELN